MFLSRYNTCILSGPKNIGNVSDTGKDALENMQCIAEVNCPEEDPGKTYKSCSDHGLNKSVQCPLLV